MIGAYGMKKLKNKNELLTASLTVEAAIVLPIFIFTCYAFLFFFYLIGIQENLHNASTKACETVASYGYLVRYIENRGEELKEKENQNSDQDNEDKESSNKNADEDEEKLVSGIEDSELATLLYCLTDATLIKSYVKKHMTINNNLSLFIKGGYSGISFLGSNLYDEDEFVTIKMSYKVKTPVFSEILPSFSVVQSVRMHSFNGYAVSKKSGESKVDPDEEMVYVTESGTVYHTYSDCTHIKINLEQVSINDISNKKNDSGGKYYGCEGCVKSKAEELEQTQATVYITKYGTRYHISTSCSKIKRSVKQIKLSEVGNKNKCSKCASRAGGKN